MNNQPTRPIPLVLAQPQHLPPATWCYWVVPQGLLAGAYPGAPQPEELRDKIKTLLDAGVRRFVNLQEAGELGHGGKPFACYQKTVRQLCPEAVCERFPIRDVSIPHRSRMVEILDAIDQAIACGQPVYVHCWGGIGRTGTVVGCWLLRHGLAVPDSVLARLTLVRKADHERSHRPSPETGEQERFVLSWKEDATSDLPRRKA